jgi:hypothetical protein
VADHPALAWRGCLVHAVDIREIEESPHLEFDDLDDTVPREYVRLDLDYVVARFDATYWVAPATLTFDASAITMTGQPTTPLVLTDVRQLEPRAGWVDPYWRITGEGLDIRMRSAGFVLRFRTPPLPVPRPSLDPAERAAP